MVAYIPHGQKITFFSFVVYKGYVFIAVLSGTGKQLFSLVAKAFTKDPQNAKFLVDSFPQEQLHFFFIYDTRVFI